MRLPHDILDIQLPDREDADNINLLSARLPDDQPSRRGAAHNINLLFLLRRCQQLRSVKGRTQWRKGEDELTFDPVTGGHPA